MIATTESIDVSKSHVILFFNDALNNEFNALPDDIRDIVQAYRKAKKVKEKTVVAIQRQPSPESPVLVLVNLGNKKEATIKNLRLLGAKAVRLVSDAIAVQWVAINEPPNWSWHLAQVISMVQYEVPHKKSAKKELKTYPTHTMIHTTKADVMAGAVIGEAVNKARSYANMPANQLTTTAFVEDIQGLFKNDRRYTVTVLTEDELKKQNMNALLGVGQGSKYPSYLVDITYDGGGQESMALVGKGVMFDTGGISIKPSRGMKEMKGDMGGAAAVIGAAWAANQLSIPHKVSFIVPVVENMVSMDAQRPGDVVVASNGTSIEITNTDAEGRLILADALVYAAKKKVDCMVDIATLTGACVVALGPYAAAVLGNHQGVVDAIIHGGESMNEPFWQLPLFDEYKDLLTSDVADYLNANESREAGTITAAKFLEAFVGDTPWAHLDIASTMSVTSDKGEVVKGMTGAGTRALIAFMLAKKRV